MSGKKPREDGKLWQTGEGSSLDPKAEAYTVGNDPVLDTFLLPYDILGTLAHADMLAKAGILAPSEHKAIVAALKTIKALHAKGEFMVVPEQEDCHTAIEQYLVEEAGDAGKKIHTGRSRNDQALTMLRLYMKDVLADLQDWLDELSAAFQAKARQARGIHMPGYTHMQKAMPATVSGWLGAYADAFADLKPIVGATAGLIDQNPLGSAAGFGVKDLPVDRGRTTKALGFAKTQANPIYCGLSRGYFELAVLQACDLVMTLSGRFAQEMLLFTTSEFGYFSLPPRFTTGSSIMPNKRNYDIFEVMRGNSKLVAGYCGQVRGIIDGLASGYQRDLALTKEPFIKGAELTKDTVKLLIHVVPMIKADAKRLEAAMTSDLYATEEAYRLVGQGMPFRDAYRQVKQQLFNGDKSDKNQ